MNQNIISTEEAKKASLAELLQKQRSTAISRFFSLMIALQKVKVDLKL
jgi:hypothetical protein